MKKGVGKFLFSACMLAAVAASGVGMSALAAEEETTSGWKIEENGDIYYYSADGEVLKGVCEIDGETYLFAETGVLKTGWQTVNEKRYYYNEETGTPVYGWLDYNGEKYYVDKKNGKHTGVSDISEEGRFVFDNSGILLKNEFTEIDGQRYYSDENGQTVSGEKTVDGVTYVFAESGVEKKGWQTIDGKRYFFDRKTGERILGTVEYNGYYYYVDEEKGKLTGNCEISGIPYILDEYGRMSQGWQIIDGNKYYYDEGKAATGLEMLDFLYYFNENGAAQLGWQTIDGEKYFFDSEYHAINGWQNLRGKTYYFDLDNYTLTTGITEINDKKYLLSTVNGELLTGFAEVDDALYYADEDGVIQTGWLTIGRSKYYLEEDGKVTVGWFEINGKKYYFSDDEENTGVMCRGLQEIDGNLYYFDDTTGVMAVNTIIGDYIIDYDGVAVKSESAQQKAAMIVSEIGKDANGIFSYVRGNNKYEDNEEITTPEKTEEKGWNFYAEYAIENRNVISTYFAAIADVLFKAAGYESRIVYGTGRSENAHYWNQVKIDDEWINYDCCNGYANVSDEYLKEINYTFSEYIYPVYKKKQTESEELK
ncbi:MAG: hypothetical protein IKI94_09660 [Ruminococcus sp.]|nr:hypothetical protein [Ruminococcus sp.]